MPNYDYLCTNPACDFKVENVQLPVDGRDYPTTEPCPTCGEMTITRPITAPGISYSGGATRPKVPETFKDVLRNIKSHHRGSTIDV